MFTLSQGALMNNLPWTCRTASRAARIPMPRMMLAFYMFVLASVLPAQSVRARVVDSASAQPIPGALVSVTDSSGRVIVRVIANEQGWFSLNMPSDAVQIKIQHIGYRPGVIRKQGTGFLTQSANISLQALPTMLQAVLVTATGTACSARPDRGMAFALLQQIREGLLAAAVARDVQDPEAQPRMKLVRYDRIIDRNSQRIFSQSVQVDSLTSGSRAFQTPRTAGALLQDGFSTEVDGQHVFYALDADVLLSDQFSSGYCFHIAPSDSAHANQVGLGFAVAKAPKGKVTIEGTVWVDTIARALRNIEYRYAGLAVVEALFKPGGVISHREMPNGSVLVDRWWMRLVGMKLDTVRGRTRGVRYEVHETGGELVRAVWPSGLTWQSDLAQVRITASTTENQLGGGILVALENSSYQARTDAHGVAEISDIVPGPYRVVVIDSVFEPIALPLTTNVAFEATRLSRHELNVRYAPRLETARSLCSAAPANRAPRRIDPARRNAAAVDSAASLFVYVTSATGTPLAGAQIADALKADDAPATFRDDMASGKTDNTGRYQNCGNYHVGETVQLWVKLPGGEPQLTVKKMNDRINVVAIAMGVGQSVVANTGEKRALRGLAFDSLHNRPLRGAVISVEGTLHTTMSDENGAFQLDGLASGAHMFTVLHASLDSIGLSAITSKFVIKAGESIQLGVPSFTSLWRNACGRVPIPADSGFIYGTLRTADNGAPIEGATISVDFLDNGITPVDGSRPRRGADEVRTKANGSYVVCGTPLDLPVRLRARVDSTETDAIDLPARGGRVQRRDLVLNRKDAGPKRTSN